MLRRKLVADILGWMDLASVLSLSLAACAVQAPARMEREPRKEALDFPAFVWRAPGAADDLELLAPFGGDPHAGLSPDRVLGFLHIAEEV